MYLCCCVAVVPSPAKPAGGGGLPAHCKVLAGKLKQPIILSLKLSKAPCHPCCQKTLTLKCFPLFSFPSLVFSCKCSKIRHHKPSQKTGHLKQQFSQCVFCQLGAPSGRAFAGGCTRMTYMVPVADQGHVLPTGLWLSSSISLPAPDRECWCSWGMGVMSHHRVAGVRMSEPCPVHTGGIDGLKALQQEGLLDIWKYFPLVLICHQPFHRHTMDSMYIGSLPLFM